MTNYRPATAADIGRDDVQLSNTGEFETGDECMLRGIGAKGHFICDHGSSFEFARVPILPEEAEPPKWYRNATPEERESMDVDLNVGSVPLDQLPELLEETKLVQYPDFPGVPQSFRGAIFNIRRKLEAGGFAEPEEVILLRGRFYPLDWILSSPGVLPQQCTIEKEPHGCATNNT